MAAWFITGMAYFGLLTLIALLVLLSNWQTKNLHVSYDVELVFIASVGLTILALAIYGSIIRWSRSGKIVTENLLSSAG